MRRRTTALRARGRESLVWIAAAFLGAAVAREPALAQESEVQPTGWTSATELSLVATGGNSDTQAFGLKERLERRWDGASLKIRAEGVRSESRASRFALLDSLSYDPSLPPEAQDLVFELVRPDPETEAEKALVEVRYDREISGSALVYGGVGWDRNREAGILSRSQAFAGVGRDWFSSEDLRFRTDVGLSFTHRRDAVEEPGRDADFLGLRLGWDYQNRWTSTTTFDNQLVANVNVGETRDSRADFNSRLAIAVNSRVALQVGLQFLFENSPGLESVDLIYVDPLTSGRRSVGKTLVRKERLDRVFSTALVIHF